MNMCNPRFHCVWNWCRQWFSWGVPQTVATWARKLNLIIYMCLECTKTDGLLQEVLIYNTFDEFSLILCRNNKHGIILWTPYRKYASYFSHYSDVITSAMKSLITSVSIVNSTICSGADQRKHQSSASLAFVRNSPHKGPVTPKMFSFDDVIMRWNCAIKYYSQTVMYRVAYGEKFFLNYLNIALTHNCCKNYSDESYRCAAIYVSYIYIYINV